MNMHCFIFVLKTILSNIYLHISRISNIYQKPKISNKNINLRTKYVLKIIMVTNVTIMVFMTFFLNLFFIPSKFALV